MHTIALTNYVVKSAAARTGFTHDISARNSKEALSAGGSRRASPVILFKLCMTWSFNPVEL